MNGYCSVTLKPERFEIASEVSDQYDSSSEVKMGSYQLQNVLILWHHTQLQRCITSKRERERERCDSQKTSYFGIICQDVGL